MILGNTVLGLDHLALYEQASSLVEIYVYNHLPCTCLKDPWGWALCSTALHSSPWASFKAVLTAL